VAEFLTRNHRFECAVVLSLFLELPRFGEDDGVAPELDKCIRPHLSGTSGSWRVDETYIQVKGAWKYLYRAVDLIGNTLNFTLSAKRDGKAATRFFCEVLKASYTQTPRVTTVDKNAVYPVAIEALKGDETLAAETELRQSKYMNNVSEQDHRNIKQLTEPMMGFGPFNMARRTLRGIEAMSMIRKGQANGIERGDSVSQVRFIEELSELFLNRTRTKRFVCH
jgi:transposase, IS6 family